jgi:hypothetical protein
VDVAICDDVEEEEEEIPLLYIVWLGVVTNGVIIGIGRSVVLVVLVERVVILGVCCEVRYKLKSIGP